MKKVWQFGLILLVLFGAIATTFDVVQPSNGGWFVQSVAQATTNALALEKSTEIALIQTGTNEVQIQSLHTSDAKADQGIADTKFRAVKLADDYVVALRMGKIYTMQATYTVASVALDATNPAIVGRAINGIWRNNPSIFETTQTDSGKIVTLYRRALTDQYLDELAKAEPARFKGKDLSAIKTELAKLRAMIQKTKDIAAKARKYYKNDPQEPSLEPNWRVENCAEVWAVRDAIFQGAKAENLVMRTVNIKNGKIKAFCRNCTVTFTDMMKAMD